jgi:O-acetyl-ADP-ribose deacetylase (regulator of RNase III)
METVNNSHDNGFEEYGTYWCQDTPIKVGKGFIQKQQFYSELSAIVCFGNSHLSKVGATMSDYVYSAAGNSVKIELQSLDKKYCPILKQDVCCPIGQSVCTSAGSLQNITNIIHTVVPNCVSPKQNRRRKQLLENAYINCLKIAQEKNILHVAFPSIGDIYEENCKPTKIIPRDEAATVAIKTIAQFVQKNPEFKEVRLVFSTSRHGNDDYAAYLNVLEQISDKQNHIATSQAIINLDKLDKLDESLLTTVKRTLLLNWAKYKNEIILGSYGTVTALCAGWILWHRK